MIAEGREELGGEEEEGELERQGEKQGVEQAGSRVAEGTKGDGELGVVVGG